MLLCVPVKQKQNRLKPADQTIGTPHVKFVKAQSAKPGQQSLRRHT